MNWGTWTALAVAIGVALFTASAENAQAENLDCVSTTFRWVGPNDKVCVSAFDDPEVPGVTCYISQARTGGVSGGLGLAEDPSRFSISCRQVGPIATDISKLKDKDSVYTERTSVFFKNTSVYRLVDKARNTLIYLAISSKIVDGSPQNALTSVPIQPWPKGTE